MQRTQSWERLAWALAIASTGAMVLGGCQGSAPSQTAASPSDPPPPVAAAPAYTPPTAEQLYQLVAPIALFPDKLLAQTLAASVYPDQLIAAQDWLRSHGGLSASDRAQATVSQSWDPSIKALTVFPDVVDQLAGNLDWTRALGDAYAHDPNDVLNAVQIMRQRAQASGHLRSSPQQQVQVARHVVVTPILDAGRVPPPTQVITIEPAQPDVVYLPRYDPGVVYGTPVDVDRTYRYHPVRWYDQGDVVTTGLVSFGVGVLVGSALEHHHGWFGWASPAPAWHRWGWNSWGVDWNAPPSAPHYVVYQQHVYAPQTTVINNRTTYTDARSYVRQDQRRWSNGALPSASGTAVVPDASPGVRTAVPVAMAASAQSLQAAPRSGAFARAPSDPHRAPDYAHLSAPRFNAQMLQPGRPVTMHAPSPLPANLPTPAQVALHGQSVPAPMVASADHSDTRHPDTRAIALQSARPPRAAMPAPPRSLQTVLPRLAGIEHAPQATLPPREAFANLQQPHQARQPEREAPQLRNAPMRGQSSAPPQQHAAFVEPQRVERGRQLSYPVQHQAAQAQAPPQQHPQRVASFTPPRQAPARPAETHPQRQRAQASQHHDHRHDS
ncbi:DUF3300 domain-containing protein [Xanthomonas cucurbitae]|uniref:DUF3300 domain-containing protein n=1 Tax=Xanthomonas cucurbitae TaxID=56453 RepID=A0ABY7YHI9_9XANT|nr:DUF3300 domain-containing protein [Xanthomonas cucurbitae]WDM69442.1 DUF3300 domain-containing protein [Xanthomonas cucurbitae]WDM73315.1 DUF3300 domain-containing protein [Xanthomonas cucurbitae]